MKPSILIAVLLSFTGMCLAQPVEDAASTGVGEDRGVRH
jgi:hypothetical protein